MKLGPIAQKLRLINSLYFEDRVAGAAELSFVMGEENVPIEKDTVYIVPLSENASRNNLDTGIKQEITEAFGVVVVLVAAVSQRDKTALTAYDKLDNIRADIFSAILGWQLPIADYPNVESLISYGGGRLIDINRAFLWYLFEFTVDSRIGDEDGVNVGMDNLESLDLIFAQYTDNLSAIPISGVSPKLPVNQTPADDIIMEQQAEE